MAETENSKDLISVLWRGADILRSKMDANEYKDYLLGIVFYKYLSDSFLIKVYDLIYDDKPESLKIALNAYKEVLQDECAEELTEQIKSECHYVIEPDLTYTCFADAARNNSFNREQLQKAFNNIEQSDPLFGDLFADIDLYSNRLGTGDQKQSDTISSLIKEIDKADLLNSDAEILGNAYEYLIGQFASETGKKAGEFYTPQAVSKILTKIAIAGQEDKKGLSVYDPCMGSGSLLLNAKKYSKEPDYIKYYGQELNTSTYNLARMNMFLHGVVPENQKLRNGDTLDGDWPTDEETDSEETESISEEAETISKDKEKADSDQDDEKKADDKEKSLDYPAQVFSEKTDALKVQVYAEEGAFPVGTYMTVKEVKDEETLDAISESVETIVPSIIFPWRGRDTIRSL